jgi:predicted nucleic acid-binding Zn ribbon protein
MEENNVEKKEETISKEEYLKLKRNNEKKKAIITILAFAMILMMVLLLLYYLNGKGNGGNEPTPTVTATPEPTLIPNDNKVTAKEYKTSDGKYVLKISAENKIFINDKEIIENVDRIEDSKYIKIEGDFDPSPGYLTELSFLLDKETGLIIENPVTDWQVSECGYANYGEYARFCSRCKGVNFIKVYNGYLFTLDYVDGPSSVYTTTWKELGYIFDNNIKSDSTGFYVCEDIKENEDFMFECTKEIKYDFDGNKLS